MIKNFMITIGSRYFIAFMNLALIILCSRYLGAEGLGFISLFVLGLALNNQVCSFFGGSALVYLAPRKNLATLIFISYTGATLMHIALVPLYLWLKPFDIVYFPEFFIISLMNVYFSTNLSLLLGKEKVETYNVLSVFQILLQVLIFGLFAVKLEKISVNHYIIASIVSNFMAMAGSAGILMNNIPHRTEELFQTFKEIFKYGFFAESGNILQLLAYRLNYFVISRWLGLAALGEFSLAVQLTEGLRLFSKGVATVEYSYFSNSNSFKESIAITRKSIVFSLVFTFTGLLVLLVIPTSLIQSFFGEEFHQTRLIVSLLAPGILLLSAGTIITPFFSGQGKHHINAIGSAICFVVTALLSFILIPWLGISGAAIVNTLAYSALTVYLYLTYKKHLRFI